MPIGLCANPECRTPIEFPPKASGSFLCPKCGAKIKIKEKIDKVEVVDDILSPHRPGAATTTTRNEPKKVMTPFRWAVAVLLALILIGSLSPRKESAAKFDRLAEKAEEAVKDRLRSPRSAEFPSRSTYRWSEADGRLFVAGYVDSQNAFGALVRGTWTVEFRGESVVDVEILSR